MLTTILFHISVVKECSRDSPESGDSRLHSKCGPDQWWCEFSNHPASSPYNTKTSTPACKPPPSLRTGRTAKHRRPSSQVHHQPPTALRPLLHHVCTFGDRTLSNPPTEVWQEEHFCFRSFSSFGSVHSHT